MPKANPKGRRLTLTELVKRFSDEGKAYEFVESIRWPNGPICPHCGSDRKPYFLQVRNGDARYTKTGHASQRRVWKCAACRKQFSVLIGTIFEDSRIPLSKWLIAIYMLCSGKNGVSAHELHRDLEITYKSAWFMAHRIRYALEQGPLQRLLAGTVEVDETYVGGKVRKTKGMTKSDLGKAMQENKTPVVSLVERGGDVRSRVMKKVTGQNIKEVLKENVDPSSRLMTDEANLYGTPGKQFASHETVNHRQGEYARGDVYTNTVEGYFSQLKRSVDGTHHHVSEQHLHRYLGEFDFRYNTRKLEDGERTVLAIKKFEGKRLMYRQPIEPDTLV